MKYVFYCIVAFIAVSCINLGNSEYYESYKGQVEISHVNIPDTIEAYSFVQIDAVAQAYNGCWSDLGFLLTKNSTFEYKLEAFGDFLSHGNCPDQMVYSDSTINLQLTQQGLYRFYVYMNPDSTLIDTLIVK